MTKVSKKNTEQAVESAQERSTWKTWVWHPFFIALYVVLALLARNVREIPLSDTYRSLFAAMIGTATLLFLLRLVFRHWQRAALVTSLFIFLLTSYGHIYAVLEPLSFAGVQIGRHRFLVVLWVLIFVAGTWAAIKIRNPNSITQLLNLVTAAALILPLITIGGYLIRSRTVATSDSSWSTNQDTLLKVPEGSQSPDIYYIILDAYARGDRLQDGFDFDNSEFLNALRSRGFYVADESTSNYLRTLYSITSSLNSDYLTNLDVDLNHPEHRLLLEIRLKDSWVRRQLEDSGYNTIALTSSYLPTEWIDADYYLIPNEENINTLRARGAYNEFEGLIIHNSIARILLDFNTLRWQISVDNFINRRLENAKEVRREIVLSAFENLAETPNLPGIKFVFAHIVTPHSPYLFGPTGEHVNYPEPITFVEKNIIPGEESWNRYRDQLQYVNIKTLETIDAILANSEEPPIIILQADHGLPTGDWADPNKPHIYNRNAILNAYYLPEDCQDQLYPTISPVNSFRVVFNCTFGTSLPMLEDKTYLDDQILGGGLRFIPIETISD